jgi:lipopolysaccharide transport system ATP-binding protein
MSDIVIKVENLSKMYFLRHQHRERYTALRDVLMTGVKSIGNKMSLHWTRESISTHNLREEFFALRDVTVEVKEGDRIGIIGPNGAGKTTLLKILSRITDPTKGRIEITGHVASLLEVGTGFHPELTGRENIFLNGAILGMRKAEIKKRFDEIVDFAEVEKFLDTPVKHYSSGMSVRLAFAVAAHLEPDILIVDEVLAVGDAQFQKKCLGKMEEVSKNEGRTVLFVSHNMTAIQNLCDTAIYLHQGTILESGNASDVVGHYLGERLRTTKYRWNGTHLENEFLQLKEIRIIQKTVEKDEFYINEDIQIEIVVSVLKNVPGAAFELFVYSGEGVAVFSSFTDPVTLHKGNTTAICTIPKNLLNNGYYTVTVGISKDYTYFIVKIQDALILDLLENPEGFGWQWDVPGVVRPKLRWDIRPGSKSM